MSAPFSLTRGTAALLVSLPHAGGEIPDEIAARLVPRARANEDLDWHVDRLYAFAHDLGASVLVSRYSRYVVDLNRSPDWTPMYPGQNNTELVPTRFFSGDALYAAGLEPDRDEIAERVAAYWAPYHDALASELERLRGEHDRVFLFDGHSIEAELPWLFDGRLPDLNLGTARGTSCDEALRDRLAAVLERHPAFSSVVDGRFVGGWITRRYGRPADGVHAAQLEMCRHCYLTPSCEFDDARAALVVPVLHELASAMLGYEG